MKVEIKILETYKRTYTSVANAWLFDDCCFPFRPYCPMKEPSSFMPVSANEKSIKSKIIAYKTQDIIKKGNNNNKKKERKKYATINEEKNTEETYW